MESSLYKYLVLLIFFIPLSSISQDVEEHEYFFKIADSLYDIDARLSEEYITKAIELDPNNAKYYAFRGSLKYDYSRFRKALIDYNKAISLDSLKSSYYINKAQVVLGLDLPNEGLKLINKAIEIDSLVDWLYDKIIVLESLGMYSQSVDIYDHILEKKLYENDEERLDFIDSRDKSKELIGMEYNRSESFYPFEYLEKIDTLSYPINVAIELNVSSINNLEIDEMTFEADFRTWAYSKYPQYYVRRGIDMNYAFQDTIRVTNLNDMLYINSVNKKINYVYDDYYPEYDLYSYVPEDVRPTKAKFYHNWDLRDFPFDEQKLRIEFVVQGDSSIYEVNRFQDPTLALELDKISGLPEGQRVRSIDFKKGYQNSNVTRLFSPNESREMIFPTGIFEISVSRSGSLLFIKLFLGTFLAFMMSLSSFVINKRNFPSRIDVSVGALFVAVGNKYFVESVTPLVQVLTKADIINNISLLLIILNVFFVIGQHKPNIKIGRFENSDYTLKFSTFLFLALVFLTIIF